MLVVALAVACVAHAGDLLVDRIALVPIGGLVPSRVAVGQRVDLPLFHDVRLMATVAQVTSYMDGHAWIGPVDDGGYAVFSTYNGVTMGVVRTPDATYRIGYALGVPIVEQIVGLLALDEEAPIVPLPARSAPRAAPPTASDSGAQIDVGILYTLSAQVAAGGEDAIKAEAHLAVASANLAYANTGLVQRLRLVFVEPLFAIQEDAQDILAAFHDDPTMRSLRDQHGADVVTLLTHGAPRIGRGYQLTSENAASFADHAVNYVERGVASLGDTFAHELGHNWGAAHDKLAGGDGFRAYSHGHVNTSCRTATVMAYGLECGGGCARIPYFSSPDITLNGCSIGTVEADNARTLRETAAIVANFRQAVDGGTPVATFVDVGIEDPAWSYVENLYATGVTAGCATNPPRYCPSQIVTRGQMAVLLIRAGTYPDVITLLPPIGIFADVPLNHPFVQWIEGLYLSGLTAGCATAPLRFCPDAPITRAQMAVLLLRARHGSDYVPPPATGTVFTDVSAGVPLASWVEQLWAEGISGGCGGGNFCPNQAVTRGLAAVLLVRGLLQ